MEQVEDTPPKANNPHLIDLMLEKLFTFLLVNDMTLTTLYEQVDSVQSGKVTEQEMIEGMPLSQYESLLLLDLVLNKPSFTQQ